MVAFDGTELDSTREDRHHDTTESTGSERADAEESLRLIVHDMYELDARIHATMQSPSLHGEVVGHDDERGRDIHALTAEWHLLHAAINGLMAGRVLVMQAETSLRARPA